MGESQQYISQSQTQLKFVGKLDSIKAFNSSLKSIGFDDTATFQFSKDGLRVIVENSKYIQGNVYMTKECFSEYELTVGTVVRFSLSLNVIIECLSIFSGLESNLKFVYKGDGEPLMLVLEHHGEGDWLTDCTIKTKHYVEPTYYGIDENSPTYNYVYFRGQDFSNILNEIDNSSEKLEIKLSPKDPHFQIGIIGVMQSESSIEISRNSEMILKFACKKETSACYKYSHIKTIIKAVTVTSQVALKTDDTGLLELHFMLQSDQNGTTYSQFFVPPLVDYD